MSNTVQLVFWDVQHGQSAYLKSPNNRHIAIDLGTGSYGNNGAEFSPLLYLRNMYGVKQLDYVIITHPHVDHLDDIFNFDKLSPRVLARPKHLDKKAIIEKATDSEKPKLEKYFEINERYNQILGPEHPDNPQKPENYGGLIIKTFTPTQNSQSNINNHSIVSIFEFADIKVLLPGDNEVPSWNELKETDGFLEAAKEIDVLLAPHHGRNSGFDNDAMRHFNPRITIVSDGRHCDSSATSRYTTISRGWDVHKRNGSREKRYCLTTRNDGVIFIEFGLNDDGSRFLGVTID